MRHFSSYGQRNLKVLCYINPDITVTMATKRLEKDLVSLLFKLKFMSGTLQESLHQIHRVVRLHYLKTSYKAT